MLFDSVRFVFCAQTVEKMDFKGSAIRKYLMFTWLGDSEHSCYIYKMLAPSLVFKNTRSTGIMPSVLYCNAALQQGTGNFEDLFAVGQKKNMNMRRNMFYVTMGEVSE